MTDTALIYYARRYFKTVALAFVEFSWKKALTSCVKRTASIVGRPFQEKGENLRSNQLVGNALLDEVCDDVVVE